MRSVVAPYPALRAGARASEGDAGRPPKHAMVGKLASLIAGGVQVPVVAARAARISWNEIGEILGPWSQAAQQRYCEIIERVWLHRASVAREDGMRRSGTYSIVCSVACRHAG